MDDSEVVQRLNELDIESEEDFFDATEEDDQTETSIQQSYVIVLKEEDIRKQMEDEIQSVSDIYSVSETEASLLLPHYRKDDKFHMKWFDDAKSVRESVGLLEKPLDPSSDDKEFYCGVCSKLHPLEKSASVSCSHRVCNFCWTRHINNIINETPAAEWNLWLNCPYVSCPASVGRDMIKRFASKEDKSKYDRYLLTSYVEDNKTMKLCPRVASGRSCETDHSPDPATSSVYCVCFLGFCWNCRKDVHSLVDCETAEKWLAMNSSDCQNSDWFLANTVPCPKCKRRIRETQFFSLKMKCLPPCNHDFCWLCRGDWTEHGEETCDSDAVSYEENDQQLKMAEFAAERYTYCYENWKSDELLMQKAKANLQKLRTDIIPKLSSIQLPTEPQLEFIIEAGFQIMECRRVLKWSHAYEYYLREDEAIKQGILKIKQENMKLLLKKLDHCVDTELLQFLDAEGSSEDFNKFCIKLTELTSSIRKQNESLVRELENGLANFGSASEMSQNEYNEEASGSGNNHDD